jgi:hypothetical protein
MDVEKLAISITTSGQPPAPGLENAGAPAPVDPNTGQHTAYWVLSEAERAKGLVRPVRRSYRHVGTRPKYPTRDLTDEELQRNAGCSYVKFEEYPKGESSLVGRYWTAAQLDSGCGTMTTMSRAIAETYARDPKYYGSTFCCECRGHFPVGERGEFVWEGADEKVGT